MTSSIFAAVEMAPRDPILGLNEAFNAAGSPWQLLVQNAVWGSGDLKADNKAVTDVLSAQ